MYVFLIFEPWDGQLGFQVIILSTIYLGPNLWKYIYIQVYGRPQENKDSQIRIKKIKKVIKNMDACWCKGWSSMKSVK